MDNLPLTSSNLSHGRSPYILSKTVYVGKKGSHLGLCIRTQLNNTFRQAPSCQEPCDRRHPPSFASKWLSIANAGVTCKEQIDREESAVQGHSLIPSHSV